MLFINRTQEIVELNQIAAEPKAQFVMVYGRRRVGKTTLLTNWAAQSGLPTFYWVAKREPRQVLMANLAQHIYAWEHQTDQPDVEIRPNDWDAALGMLLQAMGKNKSIVILDELPYVLESDPGFTSYLQAAWDHQFKHTKISFFVSGSHMGMMTRLVEYQAPLYGRFTAQLPILPLSFKDIAGFLPNYDVYRRLAVYAILGGIPAYLEQWNSTESLNANIERLFLKRTGWFRNEPMVLLSDLTQRETDNYEAILRAIASGNHIREKIAAATAIPTESLSHYLPRLLDLRLVERRIPATVPLPKRGVSKESRYFLSDPFLRFYYRFVDPNLHLIEQGLEKRLWTSMQENFRAFVADTFEEQCRQWIMVNAQRGTLPFEPDVVGGHWGREAQVDVVAISWREKEILLGEAKWGEGTVGREVIRELVDKTPLVVPERGEGWKVYYFYFAREGFTEAARRDAALNPSRLITFSEMVESYA